MTLYNDNKEVKDKQEVNNNLKSMGKMNVESGGYKWSKVGNSWNVSYQYFVYVIIDLFYKTNGIPYSI